MSGVRRREVLGLALSASASGVLAATADGACATGRAGAGARAGTGDPARAAGGTADRLEGRRTGPDTDLIDRRPGLIRPRRIVVDRGLAPERARRCVLLAQELYTFWDTGDVRHLRRAVVADFRDNTPPPGRAQGRAGVAAASRAFRAAIPDLRCELADLAITGDRITARQVYRGHFTGVYDGVRGGGQAIRFDAIDIQRVGRTRIVEDWHLEDTASLLRQLGISSTSRARG